MTNNISDDQAVSVEPIEDREGDGVLANCLKNARLVGEDVCGYDGKVIEVDDDGLCQEKSCPFRERES